MSYSQAIEGLSRAFACWTDGNTLEMHRVMVEAWPECPPADVVKMSALVDLREGTPFYVSPDICGLIQEAALVVPDDAILHADMVPCESGFVYFASPLVFSYAYDPSRTVLTWGMAWGPSGTPGHKGFMFYGRLGNLDYPCSTAGWANGESVTQFEPIQHRKTIFAFFAFIAQRVLTSTRRPAERAVRKRAAIHRPDVPDVRIVQLRRPVCSSASQHSDSAPEYSCRWMVSPHWRNQACGSGQSERRPVFIMPYVKGPEDKPLKPPRAKVFAVVR